MSDTTVSDILDKFGGGAAVAERFGLGDKAIWQWERRGIPGRWQLPLLEWARAEKWSKGEQERLARALLSTANQRRAG